MKTARAATASSPSTVTKLPAALIGGGDFIWVDVRVNGVVLLHAIHQSRNKTCPWKETSDVALRQLEEANKK